MNPDTPQPPPENGGPFPIYQVVVDPQGAAWAACDAGLLARIGGVWQLVLPGAAYLQSHTVLAPGGFVMVGGSAGGIVFSKDGGQTWGSSWVEQTQAPVNALAASPNLATDGVLLAATQGDGMLRSADGGRSFHLSNFGLRNFEVFALAALSPWQRREVVFTATGDGIYRSPNGGRAWKLAGLGGKVVLSVAVTAGADDGAPQAPRRIYGSDDAGHRNAIVLAGTEDGGLFRSVDCGVSWAAVAGPGAASEPVNALAFDAGGQAWAADGQAVWLSPDRGATWAHLAGSPAGVLSIAVPPRSSPTGKLLFATAEDGIWSADANGAGWQPEFQLVKR